MDALRVLLIEKDPKKSERISSVLANAHHDVFPASDFKDASEALLIQKFDAVLVGSSDEAVAEFAANLRALERRQRNPVHTTVLSFSPQLPQGSGWSRASDGALDGYLPNDFEAEAFSEAVNALARALPQQAVTETRSAHSELQVFDEAQFRQQIGHDPDLLIEIIDLFLAERTDQINEMRSALGAKDYDRLSRLAHTMKGSVGTLHAAQAKTRAEELELAARKREHAICGPTLAALEGDLEVLERYLLSLRRSSGKR
jgi:HPt (histidine-containing phosphotransfer) domain-containing protein